MKIVENFPWNKTSTSAQKKNAFNKLGFSKCLNDLFKMSLQSEIRLLKKVIIDEDEIKFRFLYVLYITTMKENKI